MRTIQASLLFATLLLQSAGVGGGDAASIPALIRKLGSRSFKDRIAATTALQERPEAEHALREAMRSADLETRRRIVEILGYYERRPVRELNAVAKEGRVDRFIELFTKGKPEKLEESSWAEACRLAETLIRLHEKQGGAKIDLLPLKELLCIGKFFNTDRITEQTDARIRLPGYWLLCAGDIDCRRITPGEAKNTFHDAPFVVAARSVYFDPAGRSRIIFAGGHVNLEGNDSTHLLVVSSSDVELNSPIGMSLIIARGKVVFSDPLVKQCRIISGKTVTFARQPTPEDRNIITENETNPLGFIRWSEPAKEKANPKAK